MNYKKNIISILKRCRDKYLYLRRKSSIEKLNALIPKSTSIFSMNCFAGRIYQDLEREYTSPTVGLFFLPQDFIKIGNDINLIKRDIEEIQNSKWSGASRVISSHGKYPIGKFVGTDIEIHFLHYPTFDEAKKKWKRRIERFNFNEYLFIAFCQNGWEDYNDYFKDFDDSPIQKKVLFTNTNFSGIKSSIISINEFINYKDSPDPYRKAHIYYKHLINYLSS